MKLDKASSLAIDLGSRPARGAWIETPACCASHRRHRVAPRAGRVD